MLAISMVASKISLNAKDGSFLKFLLDVHEELTELPVAEKTLDTCNGSDCCLKSFPCNSHTTPSLNLICSCDVSGLLSTVVNL